MALSPLLRIPRALALVPAGTRPTGDRASLLFRAESQDERALLTVDRRDKLDFDRAGLSRCRFRDHRGDQGDPRSCHRSKDESARSSNITSPSLDRDPFGKVTICNGRTFGVSSFRSCRFSFALPTFLGTQSKPMELPMRKTLAIFVLNLFLLSGATALLGACNTAAGVGQDISATGNAITGGADQSRPR